MLEIVCTARPERSASSRGWTGSSSSPAAAPTPPTPTRASRGRTSRPEASSDSAPRSSRRSRRTRATRRRPRRPASTSSRSRSRRTATRRSTRSKPSSPSARRRWMINNPDDMGIYNPDIERWVEVVHEAGGLCFYDHANFNGVMGKIRARRARLRRLHVHAAQDVRRAEGAAADRPSARTAAPRSWRRSCPAPSSRSTASGTMAGDRAAERSAACASSSATSPSS